MKKKNKKRKSILIMLRDLFFEYEFVEITRMKKSDVEILEMIESNDKKSKKALKKISDEKIQSILEDKRLIEEQNQKEAKDKYSRKNKILNYSHKMLIASFIFVFIFYLFGYNELGMDEPTIGRIGCLAYLLYALACKMTFILTLIQIRSAFVFKKNNDILCMKEINHLTKSISIKLLFIVPFTIISILNNSIYCAMLSLFLILIPVILQNILLISVFSKQNDNTKDMEGLV